MKLGELVNAYMKENHLSLRAIAADIGVDHSTIHRMIQGEPVRMDVLCKLMAWLVAPTKK